MTHSTEQPDRDDEALLLYLAGELAPRERAALEQQLASGDDALRSRLDAMTGLCESTTAGLASLDGAEGGAGRPAAVRRASQTIHRWTTDRLAPRPQPAPADRGPIMPAWAWPIAAAAVVLIGFMAWWGNRGPNLSGPDTRQLTMDDASASDASDGIAMMSDADRQLADLLALSFRQSIRMDAEVSELDATFEQLAAMPQSARTADPGADIFYSGSADGEQELW